MYLENMSDTRLQHNIVDQIRLPISRLNSKIIQKQIQKLADGQFRIEKTGKYNPNRFENFSELFFRMNQLQVNMYDAFRNNMLRIFTHYYLA